MVSQWLDLTFLSPQLSHSYSVSLGPFLNSDHLPIVINLKPNYKICKQQIAPKWIFNDLKWSEWNKKLEENLGENRLTHIDDPKLAIDTFYSALLNTSKTIFRLKSNISCSTKVNKPWWTEECSKKVAETRKAWKKWETWPTPENRTAFNKTMAEKSVLSRTPVDPHGTI